MINFKPLTKIVCLLAFLFSIASLPAQTIDWDGVRQAYIDKYQPQQMPAWLFPIIFEDGTGARDTIYLGYDPEAQDFGFPQKDTVFGQRRIDYDTSTFNAGWGFYNDAKVLKVLIWQNFHSSSIEFRKGYLPLTMYWDRHAFYDTTLPFADQSPAPVAEGLIWMIGEALPEPDDGFVGCKSHGHNPVLITDSLDPATGGGHPACIRKDSIVFIELYSLDFQIRAWGGKWLNVYEPDHDKQPAVNLSPNPFNVQTTISIDNSMPDRDNLHMQIYDLTGRIVRTVKLNNPVTILYRQDLKSGMYFFTLIQDSNAISYGKFLIY